MLSALPWLVAALTAVAVATGIFWVLRLLSSSVDRVVQLRQSDESIPAALPFWIRAPVAAVEPTAAWLGPHIPVSIRGRVQDQLKRAGVEDELTPPQFLSLVAVSAVVAGIVATVLQFSLTMVVLALATGFVMPWLWLRDLVESRRDEVIRELPLYVDMLTLALEAGGSLSVALKVATERSPDSVLRRAFIRVQGDRAPRLCAHLASDSICPRSARWWRRSFRRTRVAAVSPPCCVRNPSNGSTSGLLVLKSGPWRRRYGCSALWCYAFFPARF